MDQVKIGQFISERRRAKGWTQSQLAEKCGITDKAVSKWECGRSMPDSSLFLPLCGLLEISPNELLLGEFIEEENLKEKSNQVLMDVITNWIGMDKQDAPMDREQANCILRLKGIQKVYQTGGTYTTAIEDVSFRIYQGSFTGVMGASGSGKSTLLNLIATVDRPTKGRIEMDGINLADRSERELAELRRDRLGFVFQEYNLLEALTIEENIALALTIKELPRQAIRKTVLELANKLEIEPILQKYPHEVSGGQRQRCACARAIAGKPSLILADEPTGALDSHASRKLLETLVLLRREYGATILMATHDAVSASYCDQILFLQDGKVKTVLDRGQKTKQAYFTAILDRIAQIEEAVEHVF